MKKHRLQFVLFTALVALLLMAGTVGAAPKDGPVVSLGTAQTKYSASEDVLVTVTISNPTRQTVRILRWFTPGDGLEEPVFAVKVNGKAVPYTGAIYKRPAPTGSDYITLKSGESVTYSVNLGDYYDLSASGQYSINYAAAAYQLFSEKGNGSNTPDLLASESISFKVDGRAGKETHPSASTPARWQCLQCLHGHPANHPR